MNANQIYTEPAGRKMDAMVYESVFKKRVEVLTSKLDPDYVEYLVPTNDTNYSTDMADAWKVIDELEKHPHEYLTDIVRISHTGTRDGLLWGVRIRAIGLEKYFYVDAETAPLAICRAALLAVLGGV